MRRSEPPKIRRKPESPSTAGSVARPLPAPRPPPPVVARASSPPPRVKLPMPTPPPKRASDPPPSLQGGGANTERRTPSRLPPPQMPPAFGRPVVIEASTAEVAAGTLETLSAEFEPTLPGQRIAPPAGTPSQVRTLDHGASSREERAPRPSEDDLLATQRETDLRTKRAMADGYAATHRAPGLGTGLLTPVHNRDAETLDLPDSVPTPSYPYDSSELPTANIVAVGPSKPVVMPPPSQPNLELQTRQRNSAPRDAFFFVDHDSERTLAREVSSLPLVTPQVGASSPSSPFLDAAAPVRGLVSDSLDAFQPSNFLNDPSASFDAMSVQTGDILPAMAARAAATQPIYMSPSAPPAPTPPLGETFPRAEASARGGGATRVLSSHHNSSFPPPANHAPPPPPVQPARPLESGSLDAYPPLRFGGDPPRGYHPAPAPQWGPPPPALAETGIVRRPVPPAPVSLPAPPPRTLRWVALGLVLGAAIVLLGYRYLLRPIDPRPTLPAPVATLPAPPALPPSLDPALQPPLQVQNTPIPTPPLPTATQVATAPVAPAQIAPASASAASPKAPPSYRPPPPPPRAQAKPAQGGDPPPRPLNPEPPPPPPEPMPGQSILDNAL
ncbi:MAG: hypothetical protein U0174_10445 [Polyangiaceae bacterium]